MRLPDDKLDSIKDLCNFVDLIMGGDHTEEDLAGVEDELDSALLISELREDLGFNTNLPKVIAKQYRRIP